MRNLVTALFALFLTSSAFAQVPGAVPAAAKPAPKVEIVDGKISVHAEAVQLSRLIRLLDLATGVTSTVSPDTANRTLSVRFSNLEFNDAIRKIFDGQNLDYIILGKSIQVKGVSSAAATTGGSAAYTVAPPSPEPFRVNDAVITSPGALPSAVGTNPPPAQPTVQNPLGGVNATNAPRPAAAAPAAPAPATAPGAIPMFTPPTVVAPSTPGGATTPAPPLGTGAIPTFK